MTEPILPPPEQWASLVPARESITYRRASDARNFVAAGYALLLQVSHPVIGAGVKEYSDFQADPWGRLFRTLDFVNVLVYAGPQAAGEMGRRIRNYHKPIRGTLPDGRSYSAMEPDAYAWVHATLAEGIVAAQARFGRPLRPDQRDRLWSEWRQLGRLLGVRERDLPETWAGFRAWFDEMVDGTLERTASVDDVVTAIARPKAPDVRGLRGSAWPAARMPLSHGLEVATAGLLGPRLRERFGLRWSTTRELELRALGRAMRAATPVMPASLRCTGPAYLRWRSVPIARGDVASEHRAAFQDAA